MLIGFFPLIRSYEKTDVKHEPLWRNDILRSVLKLFKKNN